MTNRVKCVDAPCRLTSEEDYATPQGFSAVYKTLVPSVSPPEASDATMREMQLTERLTKSFFFAPKVDPVTWNTLYSCVCCCGLLSSGRDGLKQEK